MNRLEFRVACPDDGAKVEAFNERLAAAGRSHRLSLDVPFRTMRHREDSPITVEKLFCFSGDEIRGGVTVKRMMFRVDGRSEEVGLYLYPLSEGVVNPEFTMVGLMIQKELLRRHPLMYALGALHTTPAQLRSRMGWHVVPVPFHFGVLRAYSFLRRMGEVRGQRSLRFLCNVAACSGGASLGLALFRLFQRIRGRTPSLNGISTHRFDSWGEWADDIWNRVCDCYAFIGDRSTAALESLYPEGHKHLIKLCFTNDETKQPIGWAVVTVAKFENHKRFGNATLGAIVDMLAAPQDAYSVVSGALRVIQQAQADVVIVNHSDSRWNAAIEQAGLISWKTNQYLFLSPSLKQRFEPLNDCESRFFLTRGDGHGPTRLWLNE